MPYMAGPAQQLAKERFVKHERILLDGGNMTHI